MRNRDFANDEWMLSMSCLDKLYENVPKAGEIKFVIVLISSKIIEVINS